MQLQLKDEIQALKREKHALILAHYYVPGEVQEIADEIGDSYYLSKLATQTAAERIVFCGVAFMGESAKLLNPEKRVFLPDKSADCAMAHMAQIESVAQIRKTTKDLAVVCYINSTTELKACSDVCVTSSNAVEIVRKLPNRNIYFIPDENLGRYVANQVPEKNVILNNGFCPIHKSISADAVKKAIKEHPQAVFAVHPECTQEVLALASYVGSTAGMIRYMTESTAKEFLVGTEEGVLFELRRRNPKKQFYPVMENQCCMDMKKITLQKVADVLREETNEVVVNGDLREAAMKPLQRMLEMTD